MGLSIVIIDCTRKFYNGANQAMLPLGGIERAIVNLSEHLAVLGHSVSVWNRTPVDITHKSVRWIPKTSAPPAAEVVIACNDAHLLTRYSRHTSHSTFLPVMWFHNPVTFGKTMRKGRIWPLLRWKPVAVFIGSVQAAQCSTWHPFRSKAIIPHAVEEEVLQHAASMAPRGPVAAFLSQPYRGLADVICLWRDRIHSAMPDAELLIFADDLSADDFPAPAELTAANITLAGRHPRKKLLQVLDGIRVSLIPGHTDETFCLAAAESTALGIPILTYGTGALKERVRDGVNGYVASDADNFSQHLLNILKDEAEWRTLQANSLSQPQTHWNDVAETWLSLLKKNMNL